MAVTIDPTAVIDCDHFEAGEGTIIRAHARIHGKSVTLGRECFIDEYAVIGGGSAGTLVAGDWLHMGMFSQVNTARNVTIGDEVGIGIGTRVFTHGAYLSELDGFPVSFAPVTIGSRVWLPSAQVNPGVTIGDDVVVAANSVVTRDIPSGSLAGGTPAEVIRADAYPNPVDIARQVDIIFGIAQDCNAVGAISQFTPDAIIGDVTPISERLRNELRRHGIRYRFEPRDGKYQPW